MENITILLRLLSWFISILHQSYHTIDSHSFLLPYLSFHALPAFIARFHISITWFQDKKKFLVELLTPLFYKVIHQLLEYCRVKYCWVEYCRVKYCWVEYFRVKYYWVEYSRVKYCWVEYCRVKYCWVEYCRVKYCWVEYFGWNIIGWNILGLNIVGWNIVGWNIVGGILPGEILLGEILLGNIGKSYESAVLFDESTFLFLESFFMERIITDLLIFAHY